MISIFDECPNLIPLPDISKWNSKKIVEKQMVIIYENKYNRQKIRIFGENYVKKNKDKCELLIKDKTSELQEFSDNNDEKEIKIILIEKKFISDMSYMFANCELLSSLQDISKWKTNNVTNMSSMFFNCKSISSLPDLSKWNTDNVTNMSSMFSNCQTLLSLPDISNWNTNNVTDMSYLFSD